MHFRRHGRTCSGHPRLCAKKVVDARHKAGHDGGEAIRFAQTRVPGMTNERPRKNVLQERKTWMAGTSPAMTVERLKHGSKMWMPGIKAGMTGQSRALVGRSPAAIC
jgi:hypothetical protein